ncbi:Glutathione-regulated potassium-efflux system protein KefB [subsurface metagenome]
MGGQGLYLVLGCGDVGFVVASRLKCRDVEVAVIERDASKVEGLRWHGYAAFLGDFSSPEVLKGAGIEGAGVVVITVRDFPTIKRALNAISQLKTQRGISPLVLTLVSDEAEVPEAKRLGADEALPSNQILADFALGRLDELKSIKRLAN